MSWVLQDYRNKQKAGVEGKLIFEEYQSEIEKMKEKYGIKGFYYDGVIVKIPIKVSEILEDVKRDVLEICPDAEFEVGDIGEVMLASSSGKEILRETVYHPDYVVIKVGNYRIFMANDGFGEEENIYTKPLDEMSSKILDLLAEKYYGLKRPE